ncbi:oligosaccharide flippase family protein [Bacteroidota bacterium]
MKRKFITNLALVLSLNLLIKPFWIFGIDRTVQVMVGEAEYGIYFPLFQFSLILNVILDFGIRNFNNRDIAQHNQLLSKYLSNIFGLKIILAIVYFIIILTSGFGAGYNERQMKLLIVLALNQFISVFILYLRSNISALHYFKIDSIISVLDRFLMTIFCAILIWGNVMTNSFSVEVFAYVQTVAYLLTFLIAFIFVLSKSEFFRIRIERSYIIALLKRSFPFALLTLLMSIYTYIDAVFLERLLPDGKFQAGMYAQGFRIFSAFYMFGLLYAGLLLPMFAKMIKKKEPVDQLTQFSFLLLVVPASILIIASIFYRNEVFSILYPGHTTESPLVFAVLILGFLGTCITIIFGTLLTSNGSLKELNTMAVFAVLLNVILNIILIPKYKALGSAIAALITQGATGLVQMVLAFRIFKFHYNYKLLLTYILFFAGMISIGILFQYIKYPWFYEFFAMLIISGLFAMVIKLVRPKTLIEIIKFDD